MVFDNKCDEIAIARDFTHQTTHVANEVHAEAVMRMAGGFAMTQILHTAVKAGIADFIGDKDCTVAEIAAALRLDACALERFLRMMIVLDLLVQVNANAFSLSATGHLLRSDHPQSMRDRIIYIGAISYPVSGAALHSLRTGGGSAFEQVFGMPFFDYLAEKPELGRAFNGLMQQGVEARVPGVLGARDFSNDRYIVDLGGGSGAMLSAILDSSKRSTGAIFDRPAVIAEARQRLLGSGAYSRLKFIEGDLFAGPYPAGADLYILSNVIHDWNDVRAESILRHCVQAMQGESELLLIEETLPESVFASPSTVANDYSMLLLTGGLERSEAQYRVLLERSGLILSEVTPFAVSNNDRRRKGHWVVMRCHAK